MHGAKDQISVPQATSQRPDITNTARWNLVRDRASEALSEVLLLFFFVLLLAARSLRHLVRDIDLLSPAQEVIAPPAPSATPIPATPVQKPSTRPVPKPSRPLPRLSINPIRIVPTVESPLPSEPSSSPPSTPVLKGQEAREYVERVRQQIRQYARQQAYSPDSPSPPSSPYVPPQRRQPSRPSTGPLSSNPSTNLPSTGPPFVQLVSIVKGCFYCHNKHEDSIQHRHRNKCPWFLHHLEVGTCHLNDRGELCLGPKRNGYVTALPFWDSTISQGEQVKARTDGTEWDEVVEKRARNPVVFRH
ncbi:hypothetical protein G7Y89_g1040 [Cudoniella acicularis]|uniref:Uncharacterized protein n=1 Tax=Cudoniella acicularis TaxID=354080 RepID=A0A8H4RX46_9HELO|nr:hypothetical protein G7Y89_g1040 [Cudoniella acicularis]